MPEFFFTKNKFFADLTSTSVASTSQWLSDDLSNSNLTINELCETLSPLQINDGKNIRRIRDFKNQNSETLTFINSKKHLKDYSLNVTNENKSNIILNDCDNENALNESIQGSFLF